MSHSHPPRDDEGARCVDEALRDALSPSEETTRRIIQQALAASDDGPTSAIHHDATDSPWRRTTRRRWPWVVAAATAVILAVVFAPLHREAPTTHLSSTHTSEPHTLEPAERLRITNEDGPVVVTTPSGSRLIMLDANGARR